MTTKEITAALAALTDRLAQLEADTQYLEPVRLARQARADRAERERAAALAAMPADERAATIQALSTAELYTLLPHVPDKVGFLMDLPEDLRADVHIRQALRLKKTDREQLSVRQMQHAPRVRVEYGVEKYRLLGRGPIKERAITLTDEQAERADQAGLTVKERGDQWIWYRPELVAAWPEMLANQWTVVLEIDDQLRALVESGEVVATPLTQEELYGVALRALDEKRDASRGTESYPVYESGVY